SIPRRTMAPSSTDRELRAALLQLGFQVGPVVSSTAGFYERLLARHTLEKSAEEERSTVAGVARIGGGAEETAAAAEREEEKEAKMEEEEDKDGAKRKIAEVDEEEEEEQQLTIDDGGYALEQPQLLDADDGHATGADADEADAGSPVEAKKPEPAVRRRRFVLEVDDHVETTYLVSDRERKLATEAPVKRKAKYDKEARNLAAAARRERGTTLHNESFYEMSVEEQEKMDNLFAHLYEEEEEEAKKKKSVQPSQQLQQQRDASGRQAKESMDGSRRWLDGTENVSGMDDSLLQLQQLYSGGGHFGEMKRKNKRSREEEKEEEKKKMGEEGEKKKKEEETGVKVGVRRGLATRKESESNQVRRGREKGTVADLSIGRRRSNEGSKR
ncbi:hypothetical protein PFISCL1PPCAC_22953, partial [Pristionchus fissidentatus]